VGYSICTTAGVGHTRGRRGGVLSERRTGEMVPDYVAKDL